MGGDEMKTDKRKTAQAAAYHRKEACARVTAWNDPFGERIRANVRQCDKCGAELDEGDNAYFTGLDMLCLDCAEAEAKAQAQQDTVETIQTRFHAMEQRGRSAA